MLSQNFVQTPMTCSLNASFKTSYSQPSQIDIERKSQSKRYKHTRYKPKPYDGQDRPCRILICNMFIFCSHHAKAFFSGRASVARRVERTYQQVGLPETPPPPSTFASSFVSHGCLLSLPRRAANHGLFPKPQRRAKPRLDAYTRLHDRFPSAKREARLYSYYC